MAVVEMDNTLLRGIRLLNSSASDVQYQLGLLLYEEIKCQYGTVDPEVTSMLLNHPSDTSLPEGSTIISAGTVYDITSEMKDESRTGSSPDNELELDLLKEDLMCILCKDMDVSANNQLLECCECHNLYHQECHEPPIYQDEIDSNPSWVCAYCKKQAEALKPKPAVIEKMEIEVPKINPPISAPPSPTPPNIYLDRDFDRTVSQVKFTKSTPSIPPGVSSKSSSGSSSFGPRAVTPNISIISADKRLQIMKKKAAKMQEKRKLTRN